MSYLKHKILIFIFGFVLSTIGLQLFQTSPVTAELSRQEKQACYDKYHGHGTGRGTDNKFQGQLQRQYERSDCDRDKGGNCSINGSSQGGIVSCTDPTPDNNNGGNNNDDCDTCESGIGDEYNSEDCKNWGDDPDSNCEVIDMIILITNVLAGMAATVIVAMIIWGGIQYSTAGADPAKVQAAKQKIMNALLALLLLIFGFSIIQWLVPGGLL